MGAFESSPASSQISDDELAVVFPFLPVSERRTLSSYCQYREILANTTLLQQEDSGDFMGFLISGKLAVKKETSFAGKYILLAILQDGAMFGEISLVDQNRRTATVISMEKCRLLILNEKIVGEILKKHNELGVTLLKQVIHVLGVRLQKSGERLASLL